MRKLRSGKRLKQVKTPKLIKSVPKEPKDVQRINFVNDGQGNLIRIGGAGTGKIFVGRIYFKDGSIHRVAIKRFNDPLGDEAAMRYQQVITDLRNAGVRLPKMGMVKMKTREHPKGEWVQVSQLFGSTKKGSKIVNKGWGVANGAKGIKEIASEFTKVANAGYKPVIDFFEPFKDPRKGVILIDLDMLHKGSDSMHAADTLSHFITLLAKTNKLPKRERKALFAIAMKTASPELKENLKIKMRNAGQLGFL